jgi:uncharacterized protein (DUF1330 family)
MPKGYWIGRIDVKDEEGYKPYMAANRPIFKKCGAKLIVRGGLSGRHRNVVIEFPDLATAEACYRSPEYQENIKRRQPVSTADIIIIEGYDG